MIPVALVIGLTILALLCARFEREDRPYLALSYAAHVVTTFAFLWFYSVASGDMDGYERSARGISRLLGDDFFRWAPELVKLIAHDDSELLRLDMNPHAQTAAAHGWGGVAQFLSGGESLAAACLVVSAFGFLSKSLLFAVAKDAAGAKNRAAVAIATLFVPSFLFWTSGLVKEAFAIIGLGFTVFGLHRVFIQRRFAWIPLGIFGAAMIVSVKPYILFPLVLAVAAWFFANRKNRKNDVLYIVLAAAVAYGGLVAMGKLFPQFEIEKINAQMAGQRRGSEMAGGGSYVGGGGGELRDDEPAERSLAENLAFLPLGLVNALLRPFLFEARSIPMLGASLENTALLLVVLLLIKRHKLRAIGHAIIRTPIILSSTVFALTFAAAVGLSSKNLGTVSRYRVPLMPAYVAAVVVLRQRLGTTSGATPLVKTARPILPMSPRAPRRLPGLPVARERTAARPRRSVGSPGKG